MSKKEKNAKQSAASLVTGYYPLGATPEAAALVATNFKEILEREGFEIKTLLVRRPYGDIGFKQGLKCEIWTVFGPGSTDPRFVLHRAYEVIHLAVGEALKKHPEIKGPLGIDHDRESIFIV